MAEGFLRHYLPKYISVFSAGIEAHGVNPKAIEVMDEAGIDISSQTSNCIEDLEVSDFEYVITVCDNAKEKCPYFPATSSILHHNFPDPAKATGTENEILSSFRTTRNLIDDYCKKLSATLRKA